MSVEVGTGHLDIHGRPNRSQIRRAAEQTGRLFQSTFTKVLTQTLKATFITALAAQAGVLLIKLLSILPALTSILSLVAAVPGAIFGLIATVGILKAAFVGVGDAISAAFGDDVEKFNEALKKLSGNARAFVIELRDTVPALREVRKGIQDAFFGFGLVQEIGKLDDILKQLGPDLNFMAAGMGELASKFIEFTARSDSLAVLGELFRTFGAGIRNITANFDNLAIGIRDTIITAMPLLNSLLMGIGNVAGKFGLWLSQISASGQLKEWIDTGVATLKVLGQILGDVFVIFMRISQAAQMASGGTLEVFAELTGQLVDFLSSAKGMETLVGVFTAVMAVAQALIPPFLSLAATVLGALGPAITELAQVLGPALLTAVHALEPAIGPLVQALLAILTAITPILPIVGQLVGQLGGLLAPMITSLAPTIGLLVNLFAKLAGPVLGLLSTVLGAVLTALVPVVDTLLSSLAPILPMLINLITMLVNAVAPLVIMLGQFLAVAIQQLLPPLALLAQEVIMALLPGLQSLLPALIQILQAFMPLIPVLAQLIIGLTPLIVLIARLASVIVTQLMTYLTPLIVLLVKFVGIALEKLIPAINGVIAVVVDLGNKILNHAVKSFNEGIASLQRIWNSIKQFGSALQAAIVQVVIFGVRVVNAISSVKSSVIGFFSGAGSWLMDAGRRIIDGLISGVQGAIGRLKNVLGGVTRLIPDWKGPLSTDLKLLKPSGEALMTGLIEGIDAKTRDLFDQLRSITTGIGATPQFAGAGGLAIGDTGGGNRTVMNNVSVNVTPPAGMTSDDARNLGTTIAREISRQLDPRTVAGLVDEGRRQRSATFSQRRKL